MINPQERPYAMRPKVSATTETSAGVKKRERAATYPSRLASAAGCQRPYQTAIATAPYSVMNGKLSCSTGIITQRRMTAAATLRTAITYRQTTAMRLLGPVVKLGRLPDALSFINSPNCRRNYGKAILMQGTILIT